MATRPYGAGDGARAIGRMTGLASIGAGMVHVAAAADHSEQPLMATGFEAFAILQVALGCLLLFRLPGRPVLVAGLAMMVVSIGLWAVSRTVGLGFIPGAHAEPIGLRDAITVLFELSACVGIWELLTGARRPVGPGRLGAPSAGLMAAVAIALAAPAILVGGHSHGHGGGGGGAVHASGHAGTDGAAGHGGGPGHARENEGGAHRRGGGHAGRSHDSSAPFHSGHGSDAAGGHGHALATGSGSGHTGHSTPVAAAHPAHASAPTATHTGETHDTATGTHGGSTGPGHAPSPGGGTTHPPGHDEPPAPEPEPEPTLTQTLADEIDKLVPDRQRGG